MYVILVQNESKEDENKIITYTKHQEWEHYTKEITI